MRTAVLVIAALMNFTRRDIAYTAVILWTLAGISVKHAAIPAMALSSHLDYLWVGCADPGSGIFPAPDGKSHSIKPFEKEG